MIYGLAEKLALSRKNIKLSQSQVARQIDVSASAVSAYELGEVTPSLETLIKLANLYHVSTDYLLGISYPRDSVALDTSRLTKQQLVALQNLIDTMR